VTVGYALRLRLNPEKPEVLQPELSELASHLLKTALQLALHIVELSPCLTGFLPKKKKQNDGRR
jgi:hypothetical protein